jgi:uncharacterized protein (TIGR00369 family)
MSAENAQPERSRTYSWKDPSVAAGLVRSMSGLEFIQRIIAGDFTPPLADTMGFRLASAEAGRVTFELEPKEFHYNPIGVVHGGVALTLLDSCMSVAIHTTLPKGTAYTTLEVKANLVRAITSGTGLLRAEGKIVHGGARIATAEGRIVDQAGKLYAHGSTTCLIMPGEPKK